jgi:hypothetical protein
MVHNDVRQKTMSPSDPKSVTLELSQNEALVLFEFLGRYTEKKKLSIEDSSEDQMLSTVYCDLEKQLAQPFEPNYGNALAKARTAVRNENRAYL